MLGVKSSRHGFNIFVGLSPSSRSNCGPWTCKLSNRTENTKDIKYRDQASRGEEAANLAQLDVAIWKHVKNSNCSLEKVLQNAHF